MNRLFERNQIIVGMGAVAIAALLWSLDGVFLRPKFYIFPASVIVFLEHLLGLILLSPIIFANWKNILIINRKTWLALLWVSFFGGLIGTLMITKAFFLAIDGEASFATVIILQKLQPVFALLMARIILKEKLNNQFYWWAGLAIGASYLLSFGKNGFNFNLFDLKNEAVWFALSAAFAFGSSTVFGKRLVNNLSFSLATVLRFSLTTILAGVLLLMAGNYSDIAKIDVIYWKLLLVITFSSGAVAMYIYYFGLKKIPASLATIAELFWPLSAIFLDYIINKNILTPLQIFATIILLISFYKITLGKEQTEKRQKILYKTSGKVIHGKKRGQKIGFPTANIKLQKEIPNGVYEGIVFIADKKYRGAIFIDKTQKILEVHIINFQKRLYNIEITVIIIEKIRAIQKFKNEKDLIEQIKKDVNIISNK